ncbi:hypothetical protein [Ornithinibacillus xuwenensis]|uniref:Uncharacterized protein n=1 Tax=Ornithinibacillus xuwenensis TaxID=3144668 RepID=A0ABU9XJZ8_9BACI
MVDVIVTKVNHDFNNREQKILEVLLLNLAAHANAQTTKQDMAINPIEAVAGQVFSKQFAWQKSISEGVYKDFIEALERRFQTAFNMADIENVTIHFQENAYLLNK